MKTNKVVVGLLILVSSQFCGASAQTASADRIPDHQPSFSKLTEFFQLRDSINADPERVAVILCTSRNAERIGVLRKMRDEETFLLGFEWRAGDEDKAHYRDKEYEYFRIYRAWYHWGNKLKLQVLADGFGKASCVVIEAFSNNN